MEYILNKTPIRTTNNFKINDFKIDLDIIKTKFKDFKTKNISINTRIENNFESRIGLLEEKYLYVDVFNDNEVGYLEYDFDNDYLTSLINVNANDLIIIFKGDNAFLNTNIVINKAKTVSIINLTSKDSKSFISIENKTNSIVNFIELGGKIKVSNYYSIINNENGINTFNSIYIGKEDEVLDLNYYIGFNNKNTKGSINVEGVLLDNARKSFKGTIDFYEGSKGSSGDELENVVLLSDNAISRSLPMLLCHEEDVSGSHSVSKGKIDEDKLFYLMSRGLSEKDSKKMIILSNFNKILDNIIDINLKNELIEEITKRL